VKFSRARSLIGPTQLARATRMSIKTLRYYERRGLIRPRRTANGWRVYGRDDVERLSRIQLFKRMGFGLAEIATLLDASAESLAASFCTQEIRLLQQREDLDVSLQVLRSAINTQGFAGHAANADELSLAPRRSLRNAR
jgi:DNA-binding transcriptional MerR regulator